METTHSRLICSIGLGLLTTSPFVFLQGIYSEGFSRGVPFAIFIALWLLATVFSYVVLSIFRTAFETPLKEWIVPFLLKISVTIPIVLAWTNIVVDQMPCFLGGRGC